MFSANWRDAVLAPSATIEHALMSLTRSGMRLAISLTDDDNLLGIVTDSDVRKALLAGATLKSPIQPWLNRSPIICSESESPGALEQICRHFGLQEIPLLNGQNQVTDIFVLLSRETLFIEKSGPKLVLPPQETPMLLLAGGKGLRLRTVVSDRPKPLAVVGEKPIMQVIIEQAVKYGIRNFFVSVHYLASQIEEHLKEPSYRGLNIQIIKEKRPLGTAGSLGLIQNLIKDQVIVWNSDILSTLSPELLLKHHFKAKSAMTCAVRRCRYVVPYGVLEVKNDAIVGIREKPTLDYSASGGIYVVNRELCRKIAPESKLDMPQLMKLALDSGMKVSPFMMDNYWVDIGTPGDYQEAQSNFKAVFGKGGGENEEPSAA